MTDPIPFVPQPRSSAGRATRPVASPGKPAVAELEPEPAAEPEPGADPAWREFGELAPYLQLPGVTDVLVNGERELWIDDGSGLRRIGTWNLSERETRELAVRLVALGGRHVDEGSPCVDVRLRDGIRVHAVLPPISISGTLVSVRVPAAQRLRLADLEQRGMVTTAERRLLTRLVAERRNLLITGAAGTGKTTLLAALLAEAPAHERIVVLEDVAELRIEHPHVVSLESRQANLEGAGALTVSRLLREALRMRPDRLVVGECRGGEIRELLSALGTGHDGGAGTLHANSLDDVPARLEALGALAGMTAEALARQALTAIDVVIHLDRSDGVRRLASLGRFAVDASGRLAVDRDDSLDAGSVTDGLGQPAGEFEPLHGERVPQGERVQQTEHPQTVFHLEPEWRR